jgi:hypothetical protein
MESDSGPNALKPTPSAAGGIGQPPRSPCGRHLLMWPDRNGRHAARQGQRRNAQVALPPEAPARRQPQVARDGLPTISPASTSPTSTNSTIGRSLGSVGQSACLVRNAADQPTTRQQYGWCPHQPRGKLFLPPPSLRPGRISFPDGVGTGAPAGARCNNLPSSWCPLRGARPPGDETRQTGADQQYKEKAGGLHRHHECHIDVARHRDDRR